MINNYKIYKMVEYIKLFEFEFETYEVMENLNEVLACYDVANIDLTDEEWSLLVNELLPLAEQFEFSEVIHLALQNDPLISLIPKREFSLKFKEIERKLARENS